jgi:tetratricopeptide (TPR) repeat protein
MNDFAQRWQQALAHRQAGHWPSVETICRQLAEQHDGRVEVLQLWSMALLNLGRPADAVDLLRKLTGLAPGNAGAFYNLGCALRSAGRTDAAISALQRAVALDSRRLPFLSTLGEALVSLARYQEALPVYESMTALQPESPEAWANLGNVQWMSGRVASASNAFRRAVALRNDYAYARKRLAACLVELGQPGEGLEILEAMRKRHPDDADIVGLMATAASAQGASDRAIELYQQALEMDPDLVSAGIRLGNLYQERGQLGLAGEAYRKVLTAAPENLDALGRLAFLLERRGHLDQASAIALRGLSIDPGDPYLLLASATIRRRRAEFSDALADLDRLQSLAEGSDRVRCALAPPDGTRTGDERSIAANVQYERGNCLDRLDDTGAAFAAFSQANSFKRRTLAARRHDRMALFEEIERLVAVIPRARDALAGQAAPATRERPSPVFVVGFPRSGTTLTGNILDSHPALHVLDEAPLLDAVQRQMAHLPGGYPDCLATLEQQQLHLLRAAYFAAADELAGLVNPAPETILVDKLPLNMLKVIVLWSLFPDSRFVLVVRHPCDVCLSCFMQHFTPNPAMNNFFSLEDAARFYDTAMRTWHTCRAELAVRVHQVRYEDLLDNFAGEVAGLLDFIGVPWHENVRSFDRHARGKESIATPSYHQVTQPLYGHARYRWRRYERHMQPVLPVLGPWIKAFGYD